MPCAVDTLTTVTLKSPDYLKRVRKIVSCMAVAVGMSDDECGDLSLALTEACVNAMRHGSPNGFDDCVIVTMYAQGPTLVAEVTDCGVSDGFPENVVEGMGIRLMRTLSDDIKFVRDASGVTVRLTKRARRARPYLRA